MIYITGDTHGLFDINKLDYFNKIYISDKDVLIILGDVGIVWKNEDLENMKKIYEILGITIIFIDGNHENFHLLNTFPVIEKYGAKMHRISNNIFHVLRGEIMTINDKSFLCIGGARSIDRMYRKLNKSYWVEEMITDADIENAINNLSTRNFKVDYILTHCCDSKTIRKYFGYTSDLSTDRLQFIDKLVKYKKWFFGHYHKDRCLTSKKICVYNKIIKLEHLDKGVKRITSKLYSKYKLFYKEKSEDGYLYSNFKYLTKTKQEDLPEWFVYDYFFHQHAYVSAKGVKDLFYEPFWHFNHFMKDDHMYISYNKKIKRKIVSDLYGRKMYKYYNWDICIRGISIIDFILACEKYSLLNVENIKCMINRKAKWFNSTYKDEKPIEIPFERGEFIIMSKIWNNKIKNYW